MEKKPAFLITIDTEGDNLWGPQKAVATRNASYLPRFQELCEKYDFKPTYLTDYEMANSREFQELGRRIVKENTGEVGMHLHAWNMPPDFQLTADDQTYHPYLTDYPEDIMRAKVELMTRLLEDTFGTRMLSHRGGRWAFNETYVQILIDNGYEVDCSVTPNVSWKDTPGDPEGAGGPDFSRFPDHAYFIDPSDISRPGDSALLELPMSIMRCAFEPANRMRGLFGEFKPVRKVLDALFPPLIWLRPGKSSLKEMLGLVTRAVREGRDYVEFMLHSSEFMPGGSPTFTTAGHIEDLYSDMDRLFDAVSRHFKGYTLAEYYKTFTPPGADRQD